MFQSKSAERPRLQGAYTVVEGFSFEIQLLGQRQQQ